MTKLNCRDFLRLAAVGVPIVGLGAYELARQSAATGVAQMFPALVKSGQATSGATSSLLVNQLARQVS